MELLSKANGKCSKKLVKELLVCFCFTFVLLLFYFCLLLPSYVSSSLFLFRSPLSFSLPSGEIFCGKNIMTGDGVAIKIEKVDSDKPVLKMEVAVLKKLQSCTLFFFKFLSVLCLCLCLCLCLRLCLCLCLFGWSFGWLGSVKKVVDCIRTLWEGEGCLEKEVVFCRVCLA